MIWRKLRSRARLLRALDGGRLMRGVSSSSQMHCRFETPWAHGSVRSLLFRYTMIDPRLVTPEVQGDQLGWAPLFTPAWNDRIGILCGVSIGDSSGTLKASPDFDHEDTIDADPVTALCNKILVRTASIGAQPAARPMIYETCRGGWPDKHRMTRRF